MWALGYIIAFIAPTTLPLWWYHHELHGVLNASQLALSLFCSINVLICLWELSLFYHRATIKAHYTAMKKLLPTGGLPQPMFLFEHVSLLDALTLRFWSKVWSTYSLMDPSYSDSHTFGCVHTPRSGLAYRPLTHQRAAPHQRCRGELAEPSGSAVAKKALSSGTDLLARTSWARRVCRPSQLPASSVVCAAQPWTS